MEEEFTISQDDIDKLLAGTDSGGDVPGIEKTQVMAKEEETDSNLISQSDIDKLLMGSVEEKQEPETLIDQADIDRLLSSTDVLKMETEKSAQPNKLISQDDIDRLLNEDTNEKSIKPEDRVLDQVIIEKSPDEPEMAADEAPVAETGKSLKWNKKKILVGAVAAVLVAVIAGAGGYWVLGRKHATHEPVTAVVPDKPVVIDTHGETPAVHESGTHSLSLKDFVVLSPDSVKGVAYVSFDLSVEIVDAPSNLVKDSEQMFRNVIYEAVSKAFVLHGETNIAKEDVIKEIKDALNAVLPHGSVSKIDMNDFKMG
jgi:flagellar basal body-associated protein FliL